MDSLYKLYHDLLSGTYTLVKSGRQNNLIIRKDTCRCWLTAGYGSAKWYLSENFVAKNATQIDPNSNDIMAHIE